MKRLDRSLSHVVDSVTQLVSALELITLRLVVLGLFFYGLYRVLWAHP
jgi:hypothetical protein